MARVVVYNGGRRDNPRLVDVMKVEYVPGTDPTRRVEVFYSETVELQSLNVSTVHKDCVQFVITRNAGNGRELSYTGVVCQ